MHELTCTSNLQQHHTYHEPLHELTPQVCKILANVAHQYGRTIVCTIHQPSSDIFHMADDLIVLSNGHVSIANWVWDWDRGGTAIHGHLRFPLIKI